jgi:hypothetical protein
VSVSRYRVRLSHEHPAWPLLRQTPGQRGRWGDYEFVLDGRASGRFDYWVVCEGVLRDATTEVPPGNVILVTWEPPGGVRPHYRQQYVDQFACVVTCHRDIRHDCVHYQQQGHPWFVGKDYDTLHVEAAPDKDRLLSVVTSDKGHTEGHRQRLALARAVVDGVRGAELWGRGFQPFGDKWEVLAPYRYSLAIENLVLDDWTTEKLGDCFLARTHPFYVGCPNITRYYPEDAVTVLPADDVQAAVDIIRTTLNNADHYDRTLPAIEEARRRYLEQHQLFPMLAALLDAHRAAHAHGPASRTTVRREFERPGVLVRARHKLLGR